MHIKRTGALLIPCAGESETSMTTKQQPTLKEFDVTLHPRPITFRVYAQFPWQAVHMAEDKYGSGDVTGYGFDSYEIKDLGWPVTPCSVRGGSTL